LTERAWRRRLDTDPVLRECRRVSVPGTTVIDVGASEGLYALAMRARVGRHGRVIAFEPNPDSFAGLRLRTWHSGIDARQQAASDSATRTELHVPFAKDGTSAEVGLGSLVEPARERGVAHMVDTTRLDDLLDEDLLPISLIKIDVEGWEVETLEGAKELIRAHSPKLIVEIEQRHLARRMIDARDVVNSIADQGYRVSVISANGLSPWNDFDFEAHQRVANLRPGGDAAAYLNNFMFEPVTVAAT
jgi:FkbM family methyltransferase